MFFHIPPRLKLEESATRPSPALSPDATATAPPPLPPTDDSTPATDEKPKLESRRKSSSWKTFNLKRQLSKVDLKFKAAFAVPPETNLEEAVEEKSTSQFYCEPIEKSDAVSESNAESPDVEEKIVEIDEDESKSGDKEQNGDKSGLSSPLRVCSDVFERMHKELQEKRSSDVYDRMHKELQERWQDKERNEPAVSPEPLPTKIEEEKPPRPDNLPLFEEDGRPTRPPRQKGKNKREEVEKKEQRDQRLLSVPNIKYNRQETRETRRKHSSSQQASFAGNLMRRFSKYLVTRGAISFISSHSHMKHY